MLNLPVQKGTNMNGTSPVSIQLIKSCGYLQPIDSNIILEKRKAGLLQKVWFLSVTRHTITNLSVLRNFLLLRNVGSSISQDHSHGQNLQYIFNFSFFAVVTRQLFIEFRRLLANRENSHSFQTLFSPFIITTVLKVPTCCMMLGIKMLSIAWPPTFQSLLIHFTDRTYNSLAICFFISFSTERKNLYSLI